MSRIVTGASVSLDGYIAGPNETGFDQLFAWYNAGDVPFESTHPEIPFNLSAADHRYLTEFLDGVGVLVVGRHLFDLVDGWGGIHPLDRPVVVVTHSVPNEWVAAHPGAPFTFVTEGLEAAIDRARALAGDRNVGVNAGKIASQCLELGLLDEVYFDLVPLVLGGGTPYFDTLGSGPVELDGPDITPGSRVTHLHYVVRGH
ncbi:MAG TPA: dihydrofolate reductase family protein [Candidatus Limnocylindria bacterium]|jgi:dihydrofolate reductase